MQRDTNLLKKRSEHIKNRVYDLQKNGNNITKSISILKEELFLAERTIWKIIKDQK